MVTAQNDKSGPFPLDGCLVVITGRHQLKNALIAFYLEQTGGAECIMANSLSLARQIIADHQAIHKVIILDAEQAEADQLALLIDNSAIVDNTSLVLFDVNREANLEAAALRLGVKGFFYSNDSLEVFPKALRLVCDGELWVARSVLENALLDRNNQSRGRASDHDLTERELQILRMIGSGVRNADIAESLCISPHTVKTHIYNVFRKIGVSNRMQAARWADDNL